MDKPTVAHPDRGISFSTRKKWAIQPGKDMLEPSMHIAKWKKTVWKDCIQYNFNYMTFWNGQNYED